MTHMDHEANTRRQAIRDRRNKRLGQEAYDREKKIRNNTQAQYADFLRRYRHLHDYVESVAQQVDAGRTVTRAQAAALRKIAAERDWPIRPVKSCRKPKGTGRT